jgi:poly(glycerol-phosphate) alpha-glucosyltransferase
VARASRVHVNSESEADTVRALGVADEKLQIVPNGVPGPPRTGDAARFRARFSLGERPIVLFAGRLIEAKGVDLLLELGASWPSGPRAPVLVLAGPAENRPDLGPGPRGDSVVLTGLLKGAELQDAYSAASIFVLPSFSEGMPMTALDALAFGLPCVLSRACNLPEIARAGAGIDIDPTFESLARGLGGLVEARDRWPAMREAALALARDRFDTERVHDRHEQGYRELAARRFDSRRAAR